MTPDAMPSNSSRNQRCLRARNCDDCQRLQVAILYRESRIGDKPIDHAAPVELSMDDGMDVCLWAVYRPINIGRASTSDVDRIDRHTACS